MRRRLLFGLIPLLVVFLYAWRLGARSYWEPDEPRYAEVGREMLVSGDWVVPRLNFLKYYEKPPLSYWSAAASFALFGVSEGAGRLGALAAALLFLGGTWLLGRTLYDNRSGWIGALVLALSPLAWVTGRLLLTDIFLAAGVVWAVAGYAMGVSARARGGGTATPMLLAGLGFAAAWLAKGPIGVLIPLFGIVPARFLGGKTMGVRARGWGIAALVLALVGAPWFLLISARDPAFAWFFFVHEHVMRFATPEAHREGPIYYYVVVLLAGFFPVSLLMPWAGIRTWPGVRIGSREGRGTVLLLALGLVTLCFFSVSHSKLATYILPAAPAFALLTGRALSLVLDRTGGEQVPVSRAAAGIEASGGDSSGVNTEPSGRDPERVERGLSDPAAPRSPAEAPPLGLRVSLGIASFLTLVGTIAMAFLAARPIPPLTSGPELIVGPFLLALLAVALAAGALARSVRNLRRCLAAGAAAIFLSLMNLEMMGERADPQRTVKAAAEYVAARATPEDLVASYGAVLQGLTFYTRRRTAIIGGAGELAFGAEQEPDRAWIASDADLPRLLEGRRVWVVAPKDSVDRAIERSRGALHVVDTGARFDVLSNR